MSKIRTIVWDLGGMISMRGLWERYYSETDAVCFVVDTGDVSRLEEARLAFDSVRRDPRLLRTPFCVFAHHVVSLDSDTSVNEERRNLMNDDRDEGNIDYGDTLNVEDIATNFDLEVSLVFQGEDASNALKYLISQVDVAP
jgi:GTPase SAR1 family protein